MIKYLKTVYGYLFDLKRYSYYSRSTSKYLHTFYKNLELYKDTSDKGKNILMVIEQWNATPLPFWQMYVLTLLKKKNSNVTILFTDSYFYDGDNNFIMSIRNRMIKRCFTKENVHFLSMFEAKDISNYKDWIDYAVKANVVHYVKGEFDKEKSNQYGNIIKPQLEFRLSKWLSVPLDDYDIVFIPGGICSDTNFIKRLCEEKKVKYITMDAGIQDVILASTNGVAAQLGDIRRSYDLFCSNNALYTSGWKKIAKELFADRMNKNDLFSYQNVSIGEDENDYGNIGFLIMMNSVWDSAALGINTDAFHTYKEFVTETVDWVLNYSDDDITVRQHPMDRSSFQRGTDDYDSALKKEFNNNNRLHFIKAEDSVNSYKLMQKAKVVIVFSSTVALEAIMMDKTVICVSDCYYSDMGFVNKANTKKEYFDYLSSVRDSDLQPTADDIEKAMLVYFLTQKCNWVQTKFVPSCFHFQNYANAKSVDDIYKLGNVDLFVKSVIDNIPISYLNAKRMMLEEREEY